MGNCKEKLRLVIWILTFMLVVMANSVWSQYFFEPITEVDYYTVYAFRIDDSVELDTTGWLRITLPDTVQIHFKQRKQKSNIPFPKPYFCEHNDTLFVIVDNDSGLYKYINTGDDSAVFAYVEIDSVMAGRWEFSATCADTFGNVSQFAIPFNVIIEDKLYLYAPVNLKLIIKR